MFFTNISFFIGASLLSLMAAGYFFGQIIKSPTGSKKMLEINKAIRLGAAAFLNREYKVLAAVAFIIAGILFFTIDQIEALTFLVGVFTSALAAWIGMAAATRANVRVAYLAQKAFTQTFKIAFWGGSILGLTVVGLGLLGIIVIWQLTGNVQPLIGYAFGASLSALFLRVGGGIFTKAADIGADLSGKVEAGIPEDDPRNPGVIADNVGDNVGDTAGMGSDLFESYISAIVAAMVLGVLVLDNAQGLLLPLSLAGLGIISSLIGMAFVRVSKGLETAKFSEQVKGVRSAMNRGVIVANLFMLGGAGLLVQKLNDELTLFWPILAGLAAGFVIGKATEIYTSDSFWPVKQIAKASQTGPSVVLIEGLAQGMFSLIVPVLTVVTATVVAFYFGGLYGIALASVGILAVLGINLSMDSYGPIADNAAGIAEMANLPKKTRAQADALDSVGNTTAAMGKGFAIGSAALAALAWLAAYFEKANLTVANLANPNVVAGLMIGGLLAFIFSALTLKAVGRGSLAIVNEVRRQFKQIKGLLEGRAEPDYRGVVDIATRRALQEMVIPGILVIAVPILVGLWSLEALAGLLAGALMVGFLLAVMMANAGGAWDNAKKFIESGEYGGKGSDAHKAAVVGDTVGDPFKDTSGPSLNILIKLIGKVALIFIPFFL